ncbi:hypothetical protein SLEP1_g49632 [Rubroshorea leprosula]|uniref:Uncharacterized protein n=1 Tax=Rubroshorea leprosula TaxID=152421 RepID=A0AAV5LY76_9ROSI|nr:hypothetical protein SLEP1_g49632 [Rubroshorea leprosula]
MIYYPLHACNLPCTEPSSPPRTPSLAPTPALHRAQTPSPVTCALLLPRLALLPAPALHRAWPQSRVFCTRSPAACAPLLPPLASPRLLSAPNRLHSARRDRLHSAPPALCPCTPEPSSVLHASASLHTAPHPQSRAPAILLATVPSLPHMQ